VCTILPALLLDRRWASSANIRRLAPAPPER
jgi:hypothetical protein